MMQDKVVRSLVIIVLVLGAAVLSLLLLGWLTMAGMMACANVMRTTRKLPFLKRTGSVMGAL